MAAEFAIERAVWIAGAALAIVGVLGAWLSPNAAKRVAGIVLAFVGAMVALAAIGASAGAVAALAAAFAHLAVGVTMIVRLQEQYGRSEANALDADDAASEPPEREA